MAAPRKYPQELWERGMRLVQEARKEDPELSLNAEPSALRECGYLTPIEVKDGYYAQIDSEQRPLAGEPALH